MATKDTMSTIENLSNQPVYRHPEGLPGVLRDNAERWRQERQDAAEDAALNARLEKDKAVAKAGAALGAAATVAGIALSHDAAQASESEALAEQRAAHTLVLPSGDPQPEDPFTFLPSGPETDRQQESKTVTVLPFYQASPDIAALLNHSAIENESPNVMTFNFTRQPDGTIAVDGLPNPDLSRELDAVINSLGQAAYSIEINNQPYARLALFNFSLEDGSVMVVPLLHLQYALTVNQGEAPFTFTPGSFFWLETINGQSQLSYLNRPNVPGAEVTIALNTPEFRQALLDFGFDSDTLAAVGLPIIFSHYYGQLTSLPGFENGAPVAFTTPLYDQLTGTQSEPQNSIPVIATPRPSMLVSYNPGVENPPDESASIETDIDPSLYENYGLSREEYETRLNNAAAYTPESIRNDPNWHFNPEIYSYETTDPVTGDTLAYAHGLGTEKNADGRYIDDDLEKGIVRFSPPMKGDHFTMYVGISTQHPFVSEVGWDPEILNNPEAVKLIQDALVERFPVIEGNTFIIQLLADDVTIPINGNYFIRDERFAGVIPVRGNAWYFGLSKLSDADAFFVRTSIHPRPDLGNIHDKFEGYLLGAVFDTFYQLQTGKQSMEPSDSKKLMDVIYPGLLALDPSYKTTRFFSATPK